jgi:hypothetical protein
MDGVEEDASRDILRTIATTTKGSSQANEKIQKK